MLGFVAFALFGVMQDAPAAQPQTQPQLVKEKKVCRAEVNTGSRMGRSKICRTRAEWDASDAAAQRDAESARGTMGRAN
jgi:hypothetical protein